MAVFEFSLGEIGRIDAGRIVEAFDQAVKRCVKDCEDRPGLNKSRTVVLQMDIKPPANEDGQCYELIFAFGIKDTAPKRSSMAYRATVKRGSKLAVNDLSPDDPDQLTLDEGNTAFE